MDFDFSDDQTQLADAVRRYVDKAYPFERRWAIEKAGGFDAGAHAELAELGLNGLCVDDEHGGMGLGPVECMLVLTELGRGIVLEPVLQAYVAAPVLQAFASAELKAKWLPQIASGKAVVSLAHGERASRYGSSAILGSFSKGVQGSTTFTATKTGVSCAANASAFLVTGRLDDQLAMALIEANAPGVSIHAYTLQDGSAAGNVSFADASASLVATDGAAALALAQDIGIAGLCAYGVGAMEKTLALTTEYMNTRKQFGATLSSFQALRHRAADMKMALELARGMSMYASLKLAAPAAERSQAMNRAKVQLGRSMRLVGQEGVQLHGGIGVTDEYVVSHYFRALTVMEMQFGDTLHHVGEVSAKMTEHAGVFA